MSLNPDRPYNKIYTNEAQLLKQVRNCSVLTKEERAGYVAALVSIFLFNKQQLFIIEDATCLAELIYWPASYQGEDYWYRLNWALRQASYE